MRKRLLTLVLTLCLVVSLCGHGSAKTIFSAGNRIDRVELREKSVQVTYQTAEEAELVAVVCTKDEKEILASGWANVPISSEGMAEISLTGEVPEYAVVKIFLLTRREHAPLCPACTTSGYFRKPEESKDTEAGEFEPDRVITVGENGSFVVLKHGIVVIKATENTVDRNQLVSRNDETKTYRIKNPCKEIRDLQRGQILVLETAPEQYLFVRVRKLETENDTVTLSGEEGLQLSDLFDVMKVEAESAVKSRNVRWEREDLSGEATVRVREKLEIHGTSEQEFRLSAALETSGSVTTTAATGTELSLGDFSDTSMEGVSFSVSPVLKLRTEAAETVHWKIKQELGFVYDSERNEFRRIETEPEVSLTIEPEGDVELELTAKSTAALWEDTVLLWMETALNGQREVGETLTGEERLKACAVFLADKGDLRSREFIPKELTGAESFGKADVDEES